MSIIANDYTSTSSHIRNSILLGHVSTARTAKQHFRHVSDSESHLSILYPEGYSLNIVLFYCHSPLLPQLLILSLCFYCDDILNSKISN